MSSNETSRENEKSLDLMSQMIKRSFDIQEHHQRITSRPRGPPFVSTDLKALRKLDQRTNSISHHVLKPL